MKIVVGAIALLSLVGSISADGLDKSADNLVSDMEESALLSDASELNLMSDAKSQTSKAKKSGLKLRYGNTPQDLTNGIHEPNQSYLRRTSTGSRVTTFSFEKAGVSSNAISKNDAPASKVKVKTDAETQTKFDQEGRRTLRQSLKW